jgi:ubiquinone/menaquinone biosynthesis C-methylase UbiE
MNERDAPSGGDVAYAVAILEDRRRSAQPQPGPLFMHLGDFGDLAATAPVTETVFRAAQQRLTERVLDEAQIAPGHAVLDVGCGFGSTLAVLDPCVRDCLLVGVDRAARQIATAREAVPSRGSNRIEWHLADALSLPFTDGSFDRVLAVECAFHFASRARFLDEAARVLRRPGLLVLTDLMGTAEGRAAFRAGTLPEGLLRALHEGLAPFPDPFCLEGDWRELAASAGWTIEAHHDLTAAAMPSFSFIFAHRTPDFIADRHASDRGVAALAWLLERGLLRVELVSLGRR